MNRVCKLLLLAVLVVGYGHSHANANSTVKLDTTNSSQGKSSVGALTQTLYSHSNSKLISSSAIHAFVNQDLAKNLALPKFHSLRVQSFEQITNSYTVVNIQQFYRGIKISGADSVLLIDDTGQAIKWLGKTLNDSLFASMLESPATSEHEYVFRKDQEGIYRLSYEVEAEVDTNNSPSQKRFIDAHDGSLVDAFATEFSAASREVSDFAAACDDLNIFLPLVTPFTEVVESKAKRDFSRRDGDAPIASSQVNTGYELLGDGYDFLDQVLGLKSLDNQDMPLNLFVRVKYTTASLFSGVQCIGDAFNASWIPSKQTLYLHEDAMQLTEIIMHELTHGIISNGSNLEYKFQSGALNESIADAIGVSFRAWLEYGNKSTNLTTLPDDIWHIRAPNKVMRSMSNPSEVSIGKLSLPSHMSEFLDLPVETNNGGVHLNSSIMNMGFYLLANGGQHPVYPNNQPITGIGIFPAARIFALAASKLLFSQATFQDARYSFAEAATILYGENSRQWVSVHQAMDAIGVIGAWQMPANIIEMEPLEQSSPSTENIKKETPKEPVPQSPPIPKKAPVAEPEKTEKQAPTKETENEAPAPKQPEVSESEEVPESDEKQKDEAGLTEKQKQIMWIALLCLTGITLAVFAIIKLKLSHRDYDEPKHKPKQNSAAPASESKSASTQEKPHNEPDSDYYYYLQPTSGKQGVPLPNSLLCSKEGLIIGRSAQIVHIQFIHPTVSRRHIRMKHADDCLYLEDLNSSYGTYVNGNKLSPFEKVILEDNQVIKLDEFAYILKHR